MSVIYDVADDINIIDVNSMFVEKTYVDIVNDLYKLDLLKPKITTDVKRIMYHHVIHDICEFYLCSPLRKPVVLFNNTQLEDCLIFQYFTEEDILGILTSVFAKIQKTLPIRCYLSKYSGKHLKYKSNSDDGKILNTLNLIKEISNSPVKSDITFENIKKFTKKYGLIYLNQEYFTRLATKHLYIR
jgi:hypothetical protein